MSETKDFNAHYKKCSIEPVKYIRANNLDFFEGNIVKYITRHKDKNGAEDIKKVIHYAEMILEDVYGILPEAKIKENGDVVMEERESSASQESLLPEASMPIEDAIKAFRARLRREGRTEREIDIILGRK